MLKRLVTISTILGVAVLLLMIEVTTPVSAGPIGILSVFFLVYVILLGIMSWVIFFVNRVIIRVAKVFRTRRPLAKISFLRAYYFASVVSIGGIMLLAMGSVNSLGIYEIALVVAFVGMGTFYIAKRT